MLIKRASVATMALAALVLPGCVIAIGNDGGSSGQAYSGDGATKIKLSEEERASLPVVSTVADLPTVRSRHAAELSQLTPQTTLEQFRRLFPTATFVERRAGGDNIDAYSVRVEEKYRYRKESYGYVARDEMWFFFKNDVYVKRGGAHDWPK